MFSKLSLVALLLSLLASCQSTGDGFFAIEGRALVYEDTSFDASDPSTSFGEENVDVTAYGVAASFNTPIVDVVGAVDWREYESEGTPELTVGLRRRVLEFWRVHPFIEANLRYGLDLDNGVESDDYFGYNVGIGGLVDITDSFFGSVRLMYESADISFPSEDVTADGIVGMIGFGVRL